MRIQVLELPSEYAGEQSVTPFVLVIDEYAPDSEVALDALSAFGKDCGARGTFVTGETVEIVR